MDPIWTHRLRAVGLRVGDNHHHLVCRGCGVVADVDCAVGQAPCLTPSETAGFAVDEAEVVFWGLCAGCQAARRQHEHAPSTPAHGTTAIEEGVGA